MEPHKDASEREADLINRCITGDKESFDALITPYLHSISLVAYSISQNREDTEEIVQETALKAFMHLGQLRDHKSFKPWLLQIAANEARMILRKRTQSVSIEGEIQERDYQPRQFVEWRNIPSKELERKEVRAAVMEGLRNLSEGSRAVFILRDVQHLSSAETAKILCLSEARVDTKLHRARLQMREHLTALFRKPTRQWIPMSLRMMALMGKQMMRRVISCRKVMAEISNYINQCIAGELQKAIEDHLRLCDRCSTVLDTTRKVLYIVGDDRVFDLPLKCTQNWDELLKKEKGRAYPA
jgi:RNA polymerase sigma-70 factor (ECF subfamily)